jgi:cytochrome P450
VSWLRGSVSRFANGPEHADRRARVVAELARLDPAQLRVTAREHMAQELITAESGAADEVRGLLSRRVPVTTLAAGLGIADLDNTADAVIIAAAAYFPGCDSQTEQAADAATARLLDLLGSGHPAVIVAQISIMVQACEATASLIRTALQLLQATGQAGAVWTTDDVLREAARLDPPGRVSRRVARAPIELNGRQVAAGDVVHCDVAAANRDPEVYGSADEFDPSRDEAPSLSFGYGIRPCPGQAQALALAAGVVDAIRQRDQL